LRICVAGIFLSFLGANHHSTGGANHRQAIRGDSLTESPAVRDVIRLDANPQVGSVIRFDDTTRDGPRIQTDAEPQVREPELQV
jgi:hypothetical protein